jgi:ACS family hexuronate transporter-like MFS transporter
LNDIEKNEHPTASTLGNARWMILAFLFFATTVNYLDRAVLGVLLPEIRQHLHFSLETYGNIQMVFQLAYAAGSLVGGKLLDSYGTKKGFGVAAAIWSFAAILNAWARNAIQFGILRGLLGLGESPNFPACNKAVAEWFRPEERAVAMGVVNFAPNLANIFGPPLFIWLALTHGWQTCFLIMGVLGLVWLPFWFLMYRSPRRQDVSTSVNRVKISISSILKHRQVWGYAWAKFLTDPVWWFYLFWLPTYLSDVRHFSPANRGAALTIIYSIAGAGALAGGALSSFLIKGGWAVGKARKTTMLICALIIPACTLGVVVRNSSAAIVLFGLATAGHQAWMTNLFTTPADVFPSRAVGSANGFGVSMGAIGGAIFSAFIPGHVIPLIGYVPVLMTMSLFYIVAWWLVDRLMGNMEMVSL